MKKEKDKATVDESKQNVQSQTAKTADVVDEKEQGELGLDRDSLSDAEYIEKLEEKLGQCMADSMMCRTLTQRLQADFDNYRKRTTTHGEEMKQIGISMVVEKLLGVLDNCDLARKYITDASALTGFNMMESQILSALDGFGLKEIEALDLDFDPKTMNAVEREKAEGKENKVLNVVSKGYTLNGKLVRPASVKIGY